MRQTLHETHDGRMISLSDELVTLLSESDYDESKIGACGSQANVEKLIQLIQRKMTGPNGQHQDILEKKDIVALVQDCFDKHDKNCAKIDEDRQFEITEGFIHREQFSGSMRREEARRMEATEELRLAAEIAQLKGFRDSTDLRHSQDKLQRKIADAERAYFRRKMVVSKSSQMASSECRLQFSRVRDFFEDLYVVKKDGLMREHQRAMRRLEIIHRLNQSDARVKMLELQIADRVHKKKLQDLNELHIAQNMEEAIYMESMLDLLEKVQNGKEIAAKEVFELHVKHLRERQESETLRSHELAALQGEATLNIAKLMASYLQDDKENDEALQKKEEEIEAMERRKGFSTKGKQTVTVGELYDTVLWSVVKNHCGLTSSDSDYSSDFTFDDEDDDEDIGRPENLDERDSEEGGGLWYANSSQPNFSDGASCSDGSIDDNASIGIRRGSELSSAGNMHVKQLTRDYREREKKLIERQKTERRRELVVHRQAIRALKKKHQSIVEGLIETCLVERQNLREQIEQRMSELKDRHVTTTKDLRDTVMGEATTMHEALKAEDKRVEDAETESFSKAQTMISAQVFHEVRNALSSIIAMSEITYSMKKDDVVSADQLVSSVEEMLDQIKEIVDYALKMLNNVLDISKITSGTFQLNTAPFDLEDMVARATKMQQAKARRIKLVFIPSLQPKIAVSDADIVVRIMTNLISNAIKFTSNGGVQPFVCPLEDILSDEDQKEKNIQSAHAECLSRFELNIPNTKKRLIAVGVADTGSGLLKRKLKIAETAVSQCDPRSANAHGARNSGFGLYLIHLLAKSLGSRLWLTSLEKCRKFLSPEMFAATEERQHKDVRKQEGLSNLKSAGKPGRGTVLYITLPVYEDGESASTALQERKDYPQPFYANSEVEPSTSFKFCPRPLSCGRTDNTFRVLVADDVLMLRKGVLNALSGVFADCPVSFSTACSAEDMLRTVQNNPFDMIICDNLFHHDASKLRRIECSRELGPYGRPSVLLSGKCNSKKQIRDMLSEYFSSERFTLVDGDGEMTGLEAMMKLARDENPTFPTPILMVLSGNSIEIAPDLGIIVAQKPLKQGEFVKILESNAANLLRTGMCNEDSHGNSSCSDTASMTSDSDGGPLSSETSIVPVVNCHGTQIFLSQG